MSWELRFRELLREPLPTNPPCPKSSQGRATLDIGIFMRQLPDKSVRALEDSGTLKARFPPVTGRTIMMLLCASRNEWEARGPQLEGTFHLRNLGQVQPPPRSRFVPSQCDIIRQLFRPFRGGRVNVYATAARGRP